MEFTCDGQSGLEKLQVRSQSRTPQRRSKVNRKEGMKMSALSKMVAFRPSRRRWHAGYTDQAHHYHQGYWENY
jgi:hypothetical protein